MEWLILVALTVLAVIGELRFREMRRYVARIGARQEVIWKLLQAVASSNASNRIEEISSAQNHNAALIKKGKRPKGALLQGR